MSTLNTIKEKNITYNICSIIIFLLPMMVNRSGGVSFNISLADIFLPILMIAIITNSTKYNNKRIHSYNRMKSEHILYILIIGISLSINLIKILLINDTSSLISGVINVLKIVINIIYFIVFVYFFDIYGEKFENTFIKTWMYSTVMTCAMGIIGVLLYNIGIENSWCFSFRATGPLNDPNLFATYLFISLSISCIYNIRTNNRIIGLNIIVILITIFLTSSRAAIITFVVAVMFMILISIINREKTIFFKILKYLAIGTILMSVTAVIVYSSNKNDALISIINRLLDMGGSIKEDSRMLTWVNAIKVWTLNPILGSGIGTFVETTLSLGLTREGILAHNTYLSVLAELGILGLFSFVWFPLSEFIYLMRNSKNLENKLLIFSMVCVFISCLSLNLENFRCMWIFFAYIFYCSKKIKRLIM